MRLLTWNIQWGLGVDGRVNLDRIAAEVRRLGDPDVVCLQEVTAGFKELAGNDGSDQFADLARLFPSHLAVAAPALDFAGERRARKLFGNMVLSRYPVGSIERHNLPWRTLPDRECMPRGLLAVTVLTPSGPLRIMTTHIEWSASEFRDAQVDAIRNVHQEACWRVATPAAVGKAGYAPQPATKSAILCGDFNMQPGEATRARLMAPFKAPQTPQFIDAFAVLCPGKVHPPSMCLFDQTDGPARCLDYVFCTEDLAPHITEVTYDQSSRASDHQPVLLECAET